MPVLRPRDAATLIILDRALGGPVRMLMGRRHMAHRFMPGARVFPGGRVDPDDGRIETVDDFHPEVLASLLLAPRAPASPRRARALAIAAIRESWEEAGVFVGRASERTAPTSDGGAFAAFAARGLAPSLAAIRFVARAVTPPGLPRRFDTRFFAVPATAVAAILPEGGPSGELEDLAWVSFDEARALTDLAPITRMVLAGLEDRLAVDPALDPGRPVPYHRWIHNRFVRTDLVGAPHP